MTKQTMIFIHDNNITGPLGIAFTGIVPQQPITNATLPKSPYAVRITTNRTQRPSRNSKPIIIDGNMLANPVKKTVTEKTDTYTDSREITDARRKRKRKAHMIQTARKHQRNQKQMLPDWFIQSNQLSCADFYELTMDKTHHISRERLEMACKRAYDKERQQRFADCMRSLYPHGK